MTDVRMVTEVVCLKTSFYSLVLFGVVFGFFFMTALPTRFIGPVAEAHTPMIAPLVGRKHASAVSARKARISSASQALKSAGAFQKKRSETTLTAKAHKKKVFKTRKKVAHAKVKHARSSKAAKIAASAKCVANKMDSNGYCYRGVKRALKPFGVHLEGQSAYMAKDMLKEDPRFKVVAVNEFDNLLPGDILVHGKSKAHRNGHIAVYLGNGKEASDHVQKLVTSRRYGTSVVFRITQ
jgi:hypothetical protein